RPAAEHGRHPQRHERARREVRSPPAWPLQRAGPHPRRPPGHPRGQGPAAARGPARRLPGTPGGRAGRRPAAGGLVRGPRITSCRPHGPHIQGATMTLPNPAELLPRMARDLRAHLDARQISEPRFIGIQTGGLWVAQALLEELDERGPLGALNVSFYRDDFSRTGLHPQVGPSHLPFEIEGQHLVLIDDVLMSGRTVRAALNELFDYGRPASVTLV